jgi:Fe-S-cluster containining protein
MAKKKNKRQAIPPAKLREIWDRIPKMVNCKGLCQTSCGPIPVTPLERRLIKTRTGKKLAAKEQEGAIVCSALLPNGKCSVYSSRPTVCRIWGAAAGVPCTHGCKPERELTEEETNQIMREVQALSPGSDHRRQVLDMLDLLDPEYRVLWEQNNPNWKENLDKIFVDD